MFEKQQNFKWRVTKALGVKLVSNPTEKEELANRVFNLLYGDIYNNITKSRIQEKLPDEVKRKFISGWNKNSKIYKELSIELHIKHLSKEQLEALIEFHESEIGRSIKDAQLQIQKELGKEMMALNNDESDKGQIKIKSINTIIDFNNPTNNDESDS